jgi:hypothetical protein
MNLPAYSANAVNNPTAPRFGLHYFPDGEHYRQQDLYRWLPIFQRLGVAHLTLVAPLHRAIPERFIQGLLSQGIQPILHFVLPVDQDLAFHELQPLINAYAQWGVRSIAFFDRPNTRLAWKTSNWVQNRLVELFLDRFIPLSRMLLRSGITPIFPPLEPGGEYWDTTFLRHALESLERRGETRLLESLAIGAYGFLHQHPWNWGKGGPDRWPGNRPYLTPPQEQDQRGFYIFEWYAAIARAVLGQELPVILLRAGEYKRPLIDPGDRGRLQSFIEIYRQLLAAPGTEAYRQMPGNLAAASLWLLSAEPGSQYEQAALFSPNGNPKTGGETLLRYGLPVAAAQVTADGAAGDLLPQAFPLSKYVLLPRERENPVVNKIRQLADPQKIAFGSSFLDAALARQVIVFGPPEQYPNQQLSLLSRAGCEVISCGESGTELARILVIP